MIPSLAPTRQAVRWGSRLGAAVLAAASLVLVLPSHPALAAGDPQITVTLAQRWQLAGTQGMWTPYVVTVQDGGATGFTGDIYLVPNEARSVAPNTYPTYRTPVSVARGSARSVTFHVIDAPSGYV